VRDENKNKQKHCMELTMLRQKQVEFNRVFSTIKGKGVPVNAMEAYGEWKYRPSILIFGTRWNVW
jgi:hypothetical protein